MSTDAQERDFHAHRLTGLGGSDMGAVLGLSPYRTAYEVWLEKTGRAAPFTGNLATRFGTFAEQFVAEEYSRVTGQQVQRFHAVLRHPEAPIIGHVDRLVIPHGAKRASHRSEIRTDLGLECKTAGAYAIGRGGEWGEPGTDEVPQAYLIQCACYMALTGCPRWDLAALIGGNADFRVYHLKRDLELEGYLLEEASRWWRDHVIADVPPDPQSEDEARMRWPGHTPGKVAELDSETDRLIREYARVKAEMRDLEKDEKDLRNRIIPALADADEIIGRDGLKLATYRANKHSHRIDWQALAKELMLEYDIPDDRQSLLIEMNTEIRPGARVLRLAKGIESLPMEKAA